MSNKNYYSILGLDKTASESDIKKAYRDAVMKYHPDRNDGDPESEKKFKEAAEAYEVLSDPDKRRSYDMMGTGHRSPMGSGSPFSNFNPEDIFSTFFSGGFGTAPRNVINNNVSMDVEISFIEAVKGCKKEISVWRQDSCKKCNGSGFEEVQTCPGCNGTGHKTIRQDPWVIQHQMCNQCRGTGNINVKTCEDCKGAGVIGKETEHKLTIDIPAGVDTGMSLRIKGQGKTSRNNVGDLHITVEVDEHTYFKRDGINIYYNLPVTFADLVFGKQVKVPTISGDALLDIPKGTQPGTPLALWGLGIPDVRNPSMKGDLVYVIHLDVPDPLPDEYKALIEQMSVLDEKYKSVDRKTHENIINAQ